MWYTNWVVILTGESASYLIMRATQKDNLELESMSTEVLLIGRLKNTLVAISQGVMVKILQHIWLLQALKKSYHTMMKNYSEQGRACGSTTMILCSLGQTPGVNYSLLIAIFFKKTRNFPFTCTVCDKICMFKPNKFISHWRTTTSIYIHKCIIHYCFN